VLLECASGDEKVVSDLSEGGIGQINGLLRVDFLTDTAD
jgi:hypothetical protein